jgi:hypothetical protein
MLGVRAAVNSLSSEDGGANIRAETLEEHLSKTISRAPVNLQQVFAYNKVCLTGVFPVKSADAQAIGARRGLRGRDVVQSLNACGNRAGARRQWLNGSLVQARRRKHHREVWGRTRKYIPFESIVSSLC